MLDADVLIANERGVFDLDRWLAAQQDNDFELAALTAAELWHGLERAIEPFRSRRQAYIERTLGFCTIVPYTLSTARIHARLWAELESAGKPIGAHDLIVAATAVERGVPVATFNTKHFSQVRGLTVIVPS